MLTTRALIAATTASISAANTVLEVPATATVEDFSLPPVNVRINGEETTLYIANNYHVDSPDPDTLTVHMNQGGMLSQVPVIDPEHYFRPNLLGATVAFDVDLSSSVCGCVAAFHTVSMPGRTVDGSYEPGEFGTYYCDANQINGNFCPEFDIMEANIYAMATTPHTCDAPNEHGFYTNCDRQGSCAKNTRWAVPANSFGPGPENVINTLAPYHVQIEFQEEGGQFADFVTTLTQEDRTLSFSGGCPSITKAMTKDLTDGMVFAFSHWQGDIDWLTQGACTDFTECGNPTLYFTNIEFNLAY